MSITFSISGTRPAPAAGDRIVEELDQDTFRIGVIGPELEPIFEPAAASLDRYLEWSAPGARPVWERYRSGCMVVAQPAAGTDLNLSNGNACEVLAALGLPAEPMGEVRARDLRKLCATALAGSVVQADLERGRFGEVSERLIVAPRRAGYLAGRIAELAALAERAGDLGLIRWA